MKKKYVLSAIVLLGVVILGACGQKKTESESSGSSSSSEITSSSTENQQRDSEVLIGKVKEGTTSEDQRLLLESLVPAEKDSETIPFQEVVLLTNDVKIVDGDDQEVTVDKLEPGTTIEVTLVKNSPVASSLPPQIPGMSIVKIVVP
ncbi:hypothetical protein [uncultured Vagococcus sp.]|uniref:hypothetical protein n=1 Tax=uncultured Vagococcus sp. TaxID=189676 RepID=UPI0028D689BF|nr:hypothetical protein [uncultured Vagococcus sp.]